MFARLFGTAEAAPSPAPSPAAGAPVPSELRPQVAAGALPSSSPAAAPAAAVGPSRKEELLGGAPLKYGLKPPLGASDEVHRYLRERAIAQGSPRLGRIEDIAQSLESMGYSRADLDKCIEDYSSFLNLFKDGDNLSFACLQKDGTVDTRTESTAA
ncbi:hypothetical protein AB1Y20_022545 [Prymnesium parvum]|uniref:Uncharacterized protein n=1 Tax=Prymnesium parvum TaxID=97485 RepID=A0AB34JJ54_PRYPA